MGVVVFFVCVRVGGGGGIESVVRLLVWSVCFRLIMREDLFATMVDRREDFLREFRAPSDGRKPVTNLPLHTGCFVSASAFLHSKLEQQLPSGSGCSAQDSRGGLLGHQVV